MASIRFTPDDRDDRGFVKLAEPRSLADLLPTPASIQADAQRPAPRATSRAPLAAQIGSGLALLAVLAYLLLSGNRAPVAPLRIPATAAATVQTIGDGALTPSPLPAVAGRLLIAFAAPDGQPLGAIESTRLITPTAHYGSDWIQANVAGSGLIWLRAADSPDLAITGPDLAPRPTARPAPAQAAPAAPAATDPPPPPCAQAGIAGKMVEVCDYADIGDLEARAKQQWIATYGGNAGVVITPSPANWSKP